MYEFDTVVLTTGVDKQGDYWPDELLHGALAHLNGDRALGFGKPNHDQLCMPYGKLTKAWIEKREERTAVVGHFICYDSARKETHSSSGIELAILDFPENPKPFDKKGEGQAEEQTTLSVDPANFESQDILNQFINDVNNIDGSICCDDGLVRKGLEVEPLIEMLLSIKDSELFWMAVGWSGARIGKFVTHTTDKTLENLGDELADIFADRLKSIIIAFRKRKSDIHSAFVTKITIPGNIEFNLVIRTDDETEDINIGLSKLKEEFQKISDLFQDADSITFGHDGNSGWEFLYLTTKTGKVIATAKCFDRTMTLHEGIVQRQNPQLEEGDANQELFLSISVQGHGERKVSRLE